MWYQDSKVRPNENELIFANYSESWVANAINRKILIKKFMNVNPELIAPGEGRILFYISCESDYIEIEEQDEYKDLKPEEKSSWQLNGLQKKFHLK